LKALTIGRAGFGGVLALFLLASACSSGNTITSARCPCTLEAFAGDGQSGRIGTVLPDPVAIQVVDSNGTPVLGALILWEVTSGGGSLRPDCIPSTCPNGGTDPAGINEAVWTLGNLAGTQTVKATSLLATGEVVFTAEATTSE